VASGTLRARPLFVRKGIMNPLGCFPPHRAGRRLILAACTAPLILAAIIFAPTISAILLGIAAVLLLIEQARQERAIRQLAANLAADGAEPKLEVSAGALGVLCRQINRLLQQRRAQQRLLALLPTPPPPIADRLADLTMPQEGQKLQIAVLALKLPGGAKATAADLQRIANDVTRQAVLHGALLDRVGDVLTLSFGALGDTPDAAMRSAYRAAFGLHSAWQELPQNERPPLCLTSGGGEALVVPGLGYTLIGTPFHDAIQLLAGAPADTLQCSEATYLHLRRLGAISAPLAATLPATRRQSYTIPFG
jgi:hypothetical protein